MSRWTTARWYLASALLVALTAACGSDDGRTAESSLSSEEPAIDAPEEGEDSLPDNGDRGGALDDDEQGVEEPGTESGEATDAGDDDSDDPASSGAGVSGVLMDISDVQSRSDAPRAGATVIVFPEADTDPLWEAIDRLFIDRPEDLSRLGVVLAADQLPDSAGWDSTDRRGRFEVVVPDGPSLLCIGEENDSGFSIAGCQPITAPATVTVGFGEAGLTVE